MSVRAFARTVALALLAAGPVLIVGQPDARAEGVVLDRIVAVVNDDIILESDLDLWMVYDERIMMEMQKLQNPSEEQLMRRYEELRPQALDWLIGRMLMLDQAAQFGITATQAEVEAYLQNLARRAGMSGVAELERAVEGSLQYGSWEQYRNKLHDDIIIFKLEGAMLNIAVSDQQVLDRYRELSKSEEAKMQVRRLVFRASDDPAERDAVLKQAKAVVRRLSGGEDIDELAAELEREAESEEVTRTSGLAILAQSDEERLARLRLEPRACRPCRSWRRRGAERASRSS